MEKRKFTVILIMVTGVLFMSYNFETTENKENEVIKVTKSHEDYVNFRLKLKSLLKNAFRVDVTMYNAVEGQCDSDPFVTASGARINTKNPSKQRFIALSRNLLKRWGGFFDYYDVVYLVGCGKKDGFYTVVDSMHERFFNKIDILENVGTPLYKFEDVRIVKL